MKIVKISALWCPACLITNKAINKIKEENPKLSIEELDYDYDEEEVSKYNPGTILPVLIFIKDGREINRLIGEKNYKEIKEVIGRD